MIISGQERCRICLDEQLQLVPFLKQVAARIGSEGPNINSWASAVSANFKTIEIWSIESIDANKPSSLRGEDLPVMQGS
jgi:hypothetical protein